MLIGIVRNPQLEHFGGWSNQKALCIASISTPSLRLFQAIRNPKTDFKPGLLGTFHYSWVVMPPHIRPAQR
jgi:hypothetical protein